MSYGITVLAMVFIVSAGLGVPMGISMLTAGFAYMFAKHQDVGLVVDQTMNGLSNNYLLLSIPLFIFVAQLMNASGVTERLLAFAQATVGRFRGGLAHVNVVSNLIFSGMSGSAVADASGPGLIVSRMMMKNGRYPAGFAVTTSAVSATLGPLVPPSIPMIFYSVIAGASTSALFLAGIVPAVLTAGALMIGISIIAKRRNFPAEAAASWLQIIPLMFKALPALLMPGLLLGIIYSGIATPTEAAAIAASYALFLAFVFYRSLHINRLFSLIAETVGQTASIGLIMSGAFVFNYAVANEGIPVLLKTTLLNWHLTSVQFLLAVNLILILLAVIIDEVTILLVIVPVLTPIATALGIDLVHFGVIIMLNMMVGLVLPPHGLLLFVMTNLTETSLSDVFKEVPFFIGVLIIMLLLTTFIPDIALTLPVFFGYVPLGH
ncbi:MAG: TRAP transporter large permease [Comamonadaceae bacterium]|nr:MAG: TRAP transporter large permease [Comamonadaceae bacterium]